MTTYKVLTPHVFRDEQTGKPLHKMPGDLVEVCNRRTAMKLKMQGTIEADDLPPRGQIPPMSALAGKCRVAVFMHTSKFYSGGRIHVHQMAWCMANMGAEVYVVTDNQPRWAADYHSHPNLKILAGSEAGKLPDDIDLLFSDGKNMMGRQVVAQKHKRPFVPLVIINFETPNWVEKFDPSSAVKMEKLEDVYKHADVLLCNSEESLKYLKEYMDVKVPTSVVPPAVNTHAITTSGNNPLDSSILKDPYVVWSARSSAYKGGEVICNAVMEYDKPLHLVLVGRPSVVPQSTHLHKVVKFDVPVTDKQKMAIMRDATVVAAPSLFEGFGMVPGEALCNGTPVLAYELDVLKQNYGDRITYATWNNQSDFKQKLYDIVEGRLTPEVDAKEACASFGMEAVENQMATVPQFQFNKRRVSAQMICYYGRSVQEAIESVYDHVDEVVIAHGPTKRWADIPGDDSLELIKTYPDKDNKIKLIERKVWEDKGDMRKACQKHMTGNHVLIVDADEIYHNLGQWIERAPSFGCPRWVHFWHDLEHYVIDASGDSRWGKQHELGGGTHNHLRWCHWRSSNNWTSFRGTVAKGADGRRLSSGMLTEKAVDASPETCIYHLGHVQGADLMRAKHAYYLQRDGDDIQRKKRESAWHGWKGQLGDCGDGIIKAVDWDVPDVVKRGFAKIQEGASRG